MPSIGLVGRTNASGGGSPPKLLAVTADAPIVRPTEGENRSYRGR